MAVTLGGTSIVPPAADGGYRVEELPRGRVINLASGKVTYEVWETVLHRHVLSWKLIAAAEFATLKSKMEVSTVQAFVPPYGGSTVNVIVMPGTWRWTPRKMGDGNTYYNCEGVLLETGT
jgi:hypothetical protein